MKKMMFGMVALTCMALASCGPMTALGPPTSATVNALDPDRASLTSSWGQVSVLTFNAGLADIFDFDLKINGSDLRVNSPQFCRVEVRAILCTVPRLPAGKNFVLPMRGSNISAVATYKRLSGQSYSSETRQ